MARPLPVILHRVISAPGVAPFVTQVTDHAAMPAYAPHVPSRNDRSGNMKANVGGIDRTLRIVAGLAILGLFFALDGSSRWWSLVGLALIGTGLIGWCPAYLPFGLNSRRSK